MPIFGSRSKRGRIDRTAGASQPPPPEIPPVPGYENIIFKDLPQRQRFVNLMESKFKATRFNSPSTLRKLGLEEDMIVLFRGTGLPNFYSMLEFTYKDLTLEFLSSWRYDEDEDMVYFRLRNIDKAMTLREFGTRFGMVWDTSVDIPDEHDSFNLWNCMTEDRIHDASLMKVNAIHDPRLRLYVRFLGATIFGKVSVDKTNKTDLLLFSGYLNVERAERWTPDIPGMMADHFTRIARRVLKNIAIGGLVTYLAKTFEDVPIEGGHAAETTMVPVFDIHHLKSKQKWIEEAGNHFLYHVAPGHMIPLPGALLPPLVPMPRRRRGERVEMPSFLIPRSTGESSRRAGRRASPVPEFVPEEPQQAPPQSFQQEPQQVPQYYQQQQNLGPPVLPHLRPPHLFDPYGFDEMRHKHERINDTLFQYKVIANMERLGLEPTPDCNPTFYHGMNEYPGGVFTDYGMTQSQWNPDFGRSYGGLAGQWLFGAGSQGGDPGQASGSGGMNPEYTMPRGGGNDDDDDDE